jgi:hypothetical protein
MRERMLISHLESSFVGLSTREIGWLVSVMQRRCVRGKGCRLAPSRNYHNRQVKTRVRTQWDFDGFRKNIPYLYGISRCQFQAHGVLDVIQFPGITS